MTGTRTEPTGGVGRTPAQLTSDSAPNDAHAAALVDDAVCLLLDRVTRTLGLPDEGAARELVAETLEVIHQRALEGRLKVAPSEPKRPLPRLPRRGQAFLFGLADLIDLFPDEGSALT